MNVVRTAWYRLACFAVLAVALGAGCQTTQPMRSFLPGQPAEALMPQSVAEATQANGAASVPVAHDGAPHDRTLAVAPGHHVNYAGKSLFSVPGYSPAAGSVPRSVPSSRCAWG